MLLDVNVFPPSAHPALSVTGSLGPSALNTSAPPSALPTVPSNGCTASQVRVGWSCLTTPCGYVYIPCVIMRRVCLQVELFVLNGREFIDLDVLVVQVNYFMTLWYHIVSHLHMLCPPSHATAIGE